jgi:GNAT superfamily N-acetyltransferase
MVNPKADPEIVVSPANEASWEDLSAVLGQAVCFESRCFCQRFRIRTRDWRSVTDEGRAAMLRDQTNCENPRATTTSGLVAYLGKEAVGWCGVGPRTGYPSLLGSRVPWAGRNEDKSDAGIWSITCFIVRVGHRRRGLTYVLAGAAVDYARQNGARAVEAYAMITHPGEEITWGELHVGSRNVFAAAGLTQMTHPTKRRAVMRIDF